MEDEFIEEFLFVPEGADYGDEIDALHDEVAALRAEVLELRETIAGITADTKAKLAHDGKQRTLDRRQKTKAAKIAAKQSDINSKRLTAVGVLTALLTFAGALVGISSWGRR